MFVFNAGEEVYELQDPHGHRWVMQTWSQVVDPDLSRADLPKLADRLKLPDGWSYRPHVLTEDAARGHHLPRRPGHPGRPDQQLFAGDRLTLRRPSRNIDCGDRTRRVVCAGYLRGRHGLYRYWPRLDSVSMARDALDDLPVTRVRM